MNFTTEEIKKLIRARLHKKLTTVLEEANWPDFYIKALDYDIKVAKDNNLFDYHQQLQKDIKRLLTNELDF